MSDRGQLEIMNREAALAAVARQARAAFEDACNSTAISKADFYKLRAADLAARQVYIDHVEAQREAAWLRCRKKA
jgi:hypothetical protein